MENKRKVILQEFVSLDGFAADTNGKTSFLDSLAGKGGKDIDEDFLREADAIDTILLGADTYRMFVDFWPTVTTDTEIVADKVNATPKIVFSKTLDNAPWGKWDEATIVKTSAAKEVKKLKQLPGRDMIVWGSISLAQSLMKNGLIDEYQLRVCPVVLGKGKPLFPNKNIGILTLKLIESKTYNTGVVLFRYRTK